MCDIFSDLFSSFDQSDSILLAAQELSQDLNHLLTSHASSNLSSY